MQFCTTNKCRLYTAIFQYMYAKHVYEIVEWGQLRWKWHPCALQCRNQLWDIWFDISALLLNFAQSIILCTVVPRSYATPNYAIFTATLFWIGSKKIRVKLFLDPQLRYLFLFPPSYAISSFFPPVTLFFPLKHRRYRNWEERK